MSDFSIERDLRAAAKARGAKVEDRGIGHFQIIGDRLVNYWPFSKTKTAHVKDAPSGAKHISIREAVALAFSAPPPAPADFSVASVKHKDIPKGFRKLSGLFKLQHGLCSLCAQPMELLNVSTLPKNERKRLFKDRDRVGMIATIDHTLPKSKARGIDNNTRAAHHACNGMKADLLIEPFPLPCFDSKRLPKIWLAPGVFIEMEAQ